MQFVVFAYYNIIIFQCYYKYIFSSISNSINVYYNIIVNTKYDKYDFL